MMNPMMRKKITQLRLRLRHTKSGAENCFSIMVRIRFLRNSAALTVSTVANSQ